MSDTKKGNEKTAENNKRKLRYLALIILAFGIYLIVTGHFILFGIPIMFLGIYFLLK